MGKLYVVATPIGNLEDITLRALRILREVSLIAAEDTRRARILLSHYDIKTPVISFYEHSPEQRRRQILDALATGDVALISEAGTPGLSDPGYDLIREAIACGIPVIPIPGPNALIAALIVSGLPTDSFIYLGFLPRRASERRTTLRAVAAEPRTLVLYEAPHRLLATLRDMLEILGDREVAIARELTKLHEEVWRGKLSDALHYFGEVGVRGELTLVIRGARDERPSTLAGWTDDALVALGRRLMAEGLSVRDAAAELARRSGRPRREAYRLLIRAEEPTRKDAE